MYYNVVDFAVDTNTYTVKIYKVLKESLEAVASVVVGEEGVIDVENLILDEATQLKYTIITPKTDIPINPFIAIVLNNAGVNEYWDRVVFSSVGNLGHAVPSNLYLSDYKMKQLIGSTLKDLLS